MVLADGWVGGMSSSVPKGPIAPNPDPRRPQVKVQVDEVWSSPSQLHVRVTVHDDNWRWRHKFYAAIPLQELEPSALTSLAELLLDLEPEEDQLTLPLF